MVSKYKCVHCVKRRDPSAAELIGGAGDTETPPEVQRSSLDFQDSDSISASPSVVLMLQEMASRMDALTDEVRQLRAENALLREALNGLSASVRTVSQSECSHFDCSESPSYASAVAANPPAGMSAPPSKPPAQDQSTHLQRPSKAVSQPPRPRATFGTAKQSMLKVAPRLPAKKSLFVSRLDPTTTASDIQELLAGTVGDKVVTCTKLKTKYDTYGSFHVSMDEHLFELVSKPEVWPDGCVFRPFYGKLWSSRRFDDPNGALTTSENGSGN
ncbi:uncharacterized protein LOC144110874 [Amblyomma americanum]